MPVLNTQPQFNRGQATIDFEQMLDAARWYTWAAKLLRRDPHLVPLAAVQPLLPPQRIYRGIQDIPLRQIVGTVGRQHDFSRRFHPLRKGILSRWVSLRLLARDDGWPPIRVYQVGNLYFVLDGHHRVSVANYMRFHTIEAEVWQYPVQIEVDIKAPVKLIQALLPQTPALSPRLKTNAAAVG
jgi:hypothetical protein